MIFRIVKFIRLRLLEIKGYLRKSKASKKEINELEGIVKRNIKDSQIKGLSLDRQFTLAYLAALQLITLSILKSGYRVNSKSHHLSAFKIAKLIFKKEAHNLLIYFEKCRKKRNLIEYKFSNVVKESEVKKIFKNLEKLKKLTI